MRRSGMFRAEAKRRGLQSIEKSLIGETFFTINRRRGIIARETG